MAENNFDKKERILQIMNSEGLTPSKFAEVIGIGRASISHIMNGRNKPSDAILTKILERFTYINPDWLILGSGSMKRETGNNQSKINREPDLFTSNAQHIPPAEKKIPEFRPKTEDKTPPPTASFNMPPIEPIFKERPEKKVIRIMIFYSDSTYEVFNPEK
jgi:transcriptional regulator with XRE-family HTH domain